MNRILRPEGAPRPSGYSDGIEARGRIVFVAGQIGTGADGRLAATDMAGQTEHALRKVLAVLSAANARKEHLTRLTWFVTDMDVYRRERSAIGKAYRAVMGDTYPAMSLVAVTALVEPGAVVEIEATAVVPDGD
jgi:enamine deaminase RidA (YjgF/YER057c/UK114 family)